MNLKNHDNKAKEKEKDKKAVPNHKEKEVKPHDEKHSGDKHHLEQELIKAKNLAEEYKDVAQRIKAEFDNYKKRIVKEYSEQISTANENLILRLLKVMDVFNRALSIEKYTDDKMKAFHDGVELIYKQFKDILTEFGLTDISPLKGEKFDPAFHEAVTGEKIQNEKYDIVLEVLEKGYKLSNKLLRPAKVKVGHVDHEQPKTEQPETEEIQG